MMIGILILIGIVCAGLSLVIAASRKSAHIWFPAYLRQALGSKPTVGPGLIHIMLCVADHYEPAWNRATYEQECGRVKTWVQKYPALASRHSDADGISPQHTFFYPEEQYRPEHLESLAGLCRKGFGDVEVHLHHDGDTAEALREKLISFKAILHEKHGLLRVDPNSRQIVYGFIHGDWALDNSARNGACCGVNNELTILRETGCYADFTLPSAPSETQTRKINSIYYALDDPQKPKSHDKGVNVAVSQIPSGDLMIVQGSLTLNWRFRKWGVFPRIENSELTSDNPPNSMRVDLWVRQHIHVRGRPNWIFIKLHTHGATESNSQVMLGKPMNDMWSYLESEYNDGVSYSLHYVTARQMYNIIKAAEAGLDGNPGRFRSFNESAQSHPRSLKTVGDPGLVPG